MPRQLHSADRLQPALLDRLTGESGAPGQPSSLGRVMSKAQLRNAVLRDLAWLFNASRLESSLDLSGSPFVRRSVINYGLPAMAGHTASTLDVGALERAIRQAILDYEPRLLRDTVQVRALTGDGAVDRHNLVALEIRGQLYAHPVPIEMLLRADVDLETGKVRVADVGTGRTV